jgi:hypothetical protein
MKVLRIFLAVLLFLPAISMADQQVTLQWDPNDPGPDFYRLFQRTEGNSYNYASPLPVSGFPNGDILHPTVTATVTVPTPKPAPPASTALAATFDRPASEISLTWQQGETSQNEVYYWVVRAGLLGEEKAATAGGPNFIDDAAGTYRNDQLQGQLLVIVNGTGAGQIRRIVSNTATRLVVEPDFETAPDATSIYRIDETSGDSNEVNQTVTGTSNVSRWDVFYSLTAGGPWTLLDSVTNTGQTAPALTNPLTAVAADERAEVFFTVVAFDDTNQFSPNATETSVVVDRRVLMPPTLSITATIPVQ